MSILTLPPELLGAIVRKLDTKSAYNLHAAGVACIQGLVTDCRLSANTLATAETLKTDFFIGVSAYLKVLNLSGVPDLDLPCLLEALTDMKSLVDLDVSYTNINMSDFMEIAAARPTLKTIAINFTFVESETMHIMDEVLLRVKNIELPRYQQALNRFENVHFVGRMHARVHGALALLMLAHADLDNLAFTTTGAGEGSRLDVSSWSEGMVAVAQFQLHYLKIPRRRSIFETPIYTVMDLKKYEGIIFCVYHKQCEISGIEIQRVFATLVLKQIVCEHFGVEIESLSTPVTRAELTVKLKGTGQGADFACFFWDVYRTEFDSAFRSKLLKIFEEYYAFDVDGSPTPVPAEHSWCRVTADTQEQNTLDYNTKFREKEKVKLKIIFSKEIQLSAMPAIYNNSDFWNKITHLSLSWKVPRDPAYFKGLFESCCSLETLQLALAPRVSKLTFLQHLKEAKSLKSFLLYRYPPEQTFPLLTYLSECESLENIYLCSLHNTSLECVADLIPLLRKLNNLYNFCMHVSLSETEAKITETCRRVTSDIGRRGLRVVLPRGSKLTPYHPYLSVFNLVYQLHPTSPQSRNVSKILTKR